MLQWCPEKVAFPVMPFFTFTFFGRVQVQAATVKALCLLQQLCLAVWSPLSLGLQLYWCAQLQAGYGPNFHQKRWHMSHGYHMFYDTKVTPKSQGSEVPRWPHRSNKRLLHSAKVRSVDVSRTSGRFSTWQPFCHPSFSKFLADTLSAS